MAGNLTAMIAAAFSGGAAPPVTTDPYFDYTTLLLPGNGTNGAQNNTFLDGSTNNFTITRNGNTTQGTFSPFSQTGWGNYFDGSSGYLTTPANTAFAFGTGDFTVEMFVNTSNLTTSGFVSHGPAATSGYWMFELSGGSFFWQASGVANILVVSASSYLSNSVWTHLCVSRVSGTTRMFANGTQIASATDNTNYSGSSSGSLSIGRSYNGTYTTGYISNLRIVKGTGVTTVTVPTAPLTAISGTSILTCQSNRFIDNSSNAFAITANGNTSVVAFSPFNPSASWSAATYGGSGYFDGNGDYLTVANNDALNLGNSDFTIEGWFFSSASFGGLFAKRGSNTVAGIVAYTDGTKIQYLCAIGGSWAVNMLGTANWVFNQWNHFAFVRSGSTFTSYINGVVSATATNSGTIDTNTGGFAIGATAADGAGSATSPFYLGNMRVVKGTAVYTTAFTPPTAPLTAITNTSLLLNFTNAGIYDATSKNDLETVGNAQISTAISAKWGSGSMYFDGSGDGVSTPNNNLIKFGTGNFTIEMWLYTSNPTTYQTIMDARSADTASSFLINTVSGRPYWYDASGAITSASLAIASNTWTHLAIARSGSTLKIFLNGTEAASGTNSNSIDPTGVIYIGRDVTNAVFWNGYMQDVRITKGYARYTANFTAPTAAFPTL